MKNISIVIVLIVAVFTFVTAQAQEGPAGPPMRGPAAQRVEQLKKVRLMETLNLDEETSIRFFSRYNKHQDEVREIQKSREELLRQLESLQRSNASDAEYEKSIQDLRTTDGKFLEARDRYWKDIRGVLSVKQFASYVLFENNFYRYLRELMRDMQQDHMPRMQRNPR